MKRAGLLGDFGDGTQSPGGQARGPENWARVLQAVIQRLGFWEPAALPFPGQTCGGLRSNNRWPPRVVSGRHAGALTLGMAALV